MTTILIAEDDDVRALLHRIVARAGYTVVGAADGRVALHLACRHRPDIVLTDLDLAHLNGLGLCRAIRVLRGSTRWRCCGGRSSRQHRFRRARCRRGCAPAGRVTP